MTEILTSTGTRHPYTQEELRILAEDGTLDPNDLTDEELEYCLNRGWLKWTRENANRLLK